MLRRRRKEGRKWEMGGGVGGRVVAMLGVGRGGGGGIFCALLIIARSQEKKLQLN